jgi:hypothetical protein
MSLETELAKNTLALAAMTEALNSLSKHFDTPKDPFFESVKTDIPLPVIAEVLESPKLLTSIPVGTDTVFYSDIAAAIVTTFKTDRAKTIAALAQFGAKKGPELKQEDYAEFLKVLLS